MRTRASAYVLLAVFSTNSINPNYLGATAIATYFEALGSAA